MFHTTRTGPRRAQQEGDDADSRVDPVDPGDLCQPRRARPAATALVRRRAVAGIGAVAALAVIGGSVVTGMTAGRSADSDQADVALVTTTSPTAGQRSAVATPTTASSARNSTGVSREQSSRTPLADPSGTASASRAAGNGGRLAETPGRAAAGGSTASSSTTPGSAKKATEKAAKKATVSKTSATTGKSAASKKATASKKSAASTKKAGSNQRTPASSSASKVDVGKASGLSAHTVAVMKAVKARYPQVSFITAGAHDHVSGRAVDIMVTGRLGDEIAAYVRADSSSLGVSYVIWAQKIWSTQRSSEGWRGMPDRGSATANHFDHVHVSVR